MSLLQTGEIELKWKCDNPSGSVGTMYEVRRRVDGGPYTFVGSSGEKSFADGAIPTGSAVVIYQVTAVRSTRRGEPALFVVNFGVGGVTVFTAHAGDDQHAAGDENIRMAA